MLSILFVLFGLSLSLGISFISAAKVLTSIEVFNSRSIWKDLPPGFLDALSEKLGSAAVATEFIAFSETSGILHNEILKLVHEEPSLAIGLVAQAVSRYANLFGGLGEFGEAERILKIALLIRPRDLNAMLNMAFASLGQNDCKTTRIIADKVLVSKPDPQSLDVLEVREVDKWSDFKRIAEGLKDMCRGRD
ncbi:MAG TPA: hypothetical protein EYG28_09625 [Nitrospiria bacterium]|nr:hypothetical protein [Candidatus Manganitrophaceae bacterium]HIL35630.1 hypothetical protein [Candidatus Manganitrophaceae bacterium]